jgi:hypothetical protein
VTGPRVSCAQCDDVAERSVVFFVRGVAYRKDLCRAHCAELVQGATKVSRGARWAPKTPAHGGTHASRARLGR